MQLRILIVDQGSGFEQDHPLPREMIAFSAATKTVASREELCDALQAQDWDAVILGRALPELPPDEAVKLVKEVRPNLSVLLLPDQPDPAVLAGVLDRLSAGLTSAHEKTARSVSVLAEILNTIPQAVFWKDSNGVYLGCNRPFANAVGMERPEDIIGKTDYDLPWSKEERESYLADDREVIRTKQNKRHILERMRKADGAHLWIVTTKVPLIDEAGNAYGVLGMYEDITEHRQADEALWRSTQMLQMVLDSIPSFVFWKDVNSVYLGCNYLFAANAGLSSPEEIVGRTDFDLPWASTEAESYVADDRRVIETGIPKLNYEETQLTADGQTMWVSTSKIPLRDHHGQIVGVLGTFEDITERKLAEEAVKREAAFNAAMLDTARAVVLLLDKEGVIIRFNRYCEEISGYSADEAIGKHVWDFLLIDEEAEPTRLAFAKSLKGQALDYFENYWKTRDGSLRRLAWSSTIIPNEKGEPEYVVGIALDVTERERMEEDKRLFYRETIRSVTDGKLEISNSSETQPYEAKAQFKQPFRNAPELSAARHKLDTYCLSQCPDSDSLSLYMTAIGEAMTNALKHAGGGHVFCGVQKGELWVGISDKGTGIATLTLPKATLKRGYSTKVSLGMGYSIMLDAADRVMLSTGPEGTTVIMFRNLRDIERSISLADLPDTWETLPSA